MKTQKPPLTAGEKYGYLTVLRQVGSSSYKCRCDCGNEIVTSRSSLVTGLTKTCGCRRRFQYTQINPGDRFGKLLIVSPAEDGFWHCLCDCGNSIDVHEKQLLGQKKHSCGCGKVTEYIHPGDKYGKLTVLEKLSSGEYRCKCDCGREINLRHTAVIKKSYCGYCDPHPLQPGEVFGYLTVISQVSEFEYRCRCICGTEITAVKQDVKRVRSCGCHKLLNRRFGNLKVVGIGDKYRCLCDCGKEVFATREELLDGKNSCDECAQKKKGIQPGDKFGKLTVIREEEPYIYNAPTGYTQKIRLYLCSCECGGTNVVRARYLKNGKIRSCGCLRHRSS